MNKSYAGVGSRKALTIAPYIEAEMTYIARQLELRKYMLRSGGAPGPDQWFERGVQNPDNKQIFLAKKGMFGNDSPLYGVCNRAMEIAEEIHPSWSSLSPLAKNLHARNVYQILGQNLDDPVEFVVCWTKDGKAVGGTRTAIMLAKRFDVPILNLGTVKNGKYIDAFENFMIFHED